MSNTIGVDLEYVVNHSKDFMAGKLTAAEYRKMLKHMMEVFDEGELMDLADILSQVEIED